MKLRGNSISEIWKLANNECGNLLELINVIFNIIYDILRLKDVYNGKKRKFMDIEDTKEKICHDLLWVKLQTKAENNAVVSITKVTKHRVENYAIQVIRIFTKVKDYD